MICPWCGVRFSPDWKFAESCYHHIPVMDVVDVPCVVWYELRTAQCAAPECMKVVVQGRIYDNMSELHPWDETTNVTIAPLLATRIPLGDAVPESIATDYREACSVLPISPKASAALSRRVLESILIEQGYKKGALSRKIKRALRDGILPKNVADIIDIVRMVGNASAHLKNHHGIVSVETKDAKWLLDIIERLIEHFYNKPEADANIAAADKAKKADLFQRKSGD